MALVAVLDAQLQCLCMPRATGPRGPARPKATRLRFCRYALVHQARTPAFFSCLCSAMRTHGHVRCPESTPHSPLLSPPARSQVDQAAPATQCVICRGRYAALRPLVELWAPAVRAPARVGSPPRGAVHRPRPTQARARANAWTVPSSRRIRLNSGRRRSACIILGGVAVLARPAAV